MDNDNDDIPIQIVSKVELAEEYIESFQELGISILKRFDEDNAQVSIAVVDDEGIVEVHKQFLNKDNTTDVISFDLTDDEDECSTFEVVVNYDQAKRQSEVRGHSVKAELALYITHGLLHNLGYDDIDESDAVEMHRMEDVILQEAGYGVVYGKNDFDNQSKG